MKPKHSTTFFKNLKNQILMDSSQGLELVDNLNEDLVKLKPKTLSVVTFVDMTLCAHWPYPAMGRESQGHVRDATNCFCFLDEPNKKEVC
jgi:hypothetical protein